MHLKYQIAHANCGCIAHIEWDRDDGDYRRAIDPDVEVIANDERGVEDARALRDQWRKVGRQPHHKWPSTIDRPGLKRVACAAHAGGDHHEHLRKLTAGD